MTVDPALIIETSKYLAEHMDAKISALDDKLTGRIEANEKAVELAHDDLVRVPTELQKAIGNVKELIDAELRILREADITSKNLREQLLTNIDTRIENLKKLTEEKFITSSTALIDFKIFIDNRFVAREKDIDVMRDSIKEIEHQREQPAFTALSATRELFKAQNEANILANDKSEKSFSKQIEASDNKIEDLKVRLAALDVRVSSAESNKKGSGETLYWIFAGISALYSILATIGIIFTSLQHHS